ncbi:MAG: aldehyde dehydrogenase family protein [Chloroflexota bacterium]
MGAATQIKQVTHANVVANSDQPNVLVSTSPATGRKLGEVWVTPPAEAEAVMTRARQAQDSWKALGLKGRLAVMRKLKRTMYRYTDLLVDTLVAEQGRPRFEALIEFWCTIELLAYDIRIAPRTLAPEHTLVPLVPHRVHWVEKNPYGTVLVIAPWNFPLLLSLTPIFSALIAGNTVVYKPSEFSTQMGEALVKVIYEAGVPREVFQIVHGAGDLGAALVKARPNKIVFTGSPTTARKIAAAAGELLIPLTLELGGKDAAIVLEDADLDRTAAGLVWGGLLNAGQACLSVERIYVRCEVADQLVAKMAKIINEQVRIGPGEAPETTMGAITTDAQLNIIDSQVREAIEQGARLVSGGRVVEDRAGRFYLPTLITNATPMMRIVSEETFGPVIAVIPVSSDEEALKQANSTRYGLTGSVWTGNRARGIALAKRMRVGHASVNDHIVSASVPSLPWGGMDDSGYGRTRGREGLLDMIVTQVISAERFKPLPRELFWYPYTPLKLTLIQRAIDVLYAPRWLDKLRALVFWQRRER